MHHGAEFTVVFIAIAALLIGAATRWLSGVVRFPYTIAMLLVGMLLGFGLEAVGHEVALAELMSAGAHISPDLIIFVFLPALVFESAYAIDVHEFKKNVGAVIVLAGPALILSTLLVGAFMMLLMPSGWGWTWPVALTFGALISATDPVAVVAIFRDLGVSKRLGVLIEGESLLNDGTSIVVFTLLMGLVTGQVQSFSLSEAVVDFVRVVAGGVLVGWVLAQLVSRWLGRLFNDPMSEITLTLVLAYSAMIIAEGLLHVSGVMAVVVAGLFMGGQVKTKVSPEVEHFLHRFWEMLGYIANTLIFFLVGLVVAIQAEHASLTDGLIILAAYTGIMLIRALLTYASQPLVSRFTDGVNRQDSAVIVWGGLRGAVSLALALIVAQNENISPELRHQILLITAGVVLLTILVNGTTIGKLLAAFGYDKPPLGQQLAHAAARVLVVDGTRRSIDAIRDEPDLRTVFWDDVLKRLGERRDRLRDKMLTLKRQLNQAGPVEQVSSYWMRAIRIERQAYWEAFSQGMLSDVAVRLLGRELERHIDHMARGQLEPPEMRTPQLPKFALDSLFDREGAMFRRLSLLYEMSRAEAFAATRVLASVESFEDIDEAVRQHLEDTYQRFQVSAKERIEDIRTNLPEMATAIERRLARRIELNFEREGFKQLVRRGSLEEEEAHAELEDVEFQMRKLQHSKTRIAIPETADLVAATPLFRNLSETALAKLAEATEEMIVHPGEVLFKQGDKGDSLFVIARGVMNILLETDGQQRLVGVLVGGDILGEISLLTGEPRSATVVAKTAGTLGRISRADFEQLLAAEPKLEQQVWEALGERNLDNALSRHPDFRRIGSDNRESWLKSCRHQVLAAGVRHEFSADTAYVFLVSGQARYAGREYQAPSLIRVQADKSLSASEVVRCIALPAPPLGGAMATLSDVSV